MGQDKSAKKFQNRNVEMSHGNIAKKYPNKNVGTFHVKNAERYPNNNAQTFLAKNANKNAKISFGAKFVINIITSTNMCKNLFSQYFYIIFGYLVLLYNKDFDYMK